MTDISMNRSLFLRTLLFSGFAFLASPGFGGPEPEYPTTAPLIESEQVLSFTWDNVDKYPLTTSLVFVPNKNELVTGGDDCRLAVWDLTNGTLKSHFRADDDWIRSLDLSSDGASMASVSHNGSIKLWNAGEWKSTKTFRKVGHGAESVSFSPDGRFLAVCGYDPQVTIFDIASGATKTTLAMPGAGNTVVKFSPDGKTLAAAGRSGIVRLWDVDTFKHRKDLRTDGRRIRALAFSLDGTLVAAGGESTCLFVWVAASGQKKQTINAAIGKTYSLGFCGNDILASGDSLNSIRIWNLGDGSEIARGYGHTGTIAALYFDPEQGKLLSGGFDTTVRFWPFLKQ
ncbi:MAG: WD40 repeat domain-containing protein [Thermoguttaceae bacterium]|jgi:WD40 repeat protein